MKQSATRSDHALILQGHAGDIEATVALPAAGQAITAVAIVCHPHPLHGGSMNNKVTFTLARTLCDLGAASFRYNFRGVGLSAGAYSEGIGETEDLLAVIRQAQELFPGKELWLAGFSFGSYVALRAAQVITPARLITVGPPVHLYDFSEIQPPACPWLLIQGTDDEVVPFREVSRWVSRLYPAPEAVYLDNVGHYFHGQLQMLREVVEKHIKSSLS